MMPFPTGRFMWLVFAAPFLSWGAAALLIYMGWVDLNLKHDFSRMEAMRILLAAFLAIAAAGGLMGLFRAGWIGATSVILLAIGVSGAFTLIGASIVLPFFAWPGAVPAIVFLIAVLNRKSRVQQPR